MAAAARTPRESFRVPNSIIQALTTSMLAGSDGEPGLNQLTAFETVALLGLMTQISPGRAHEEVRTKVSTILTIMEVSRHVAHAVEREWTSQEGKVVRKR